MNPKNPTIDIVRGIAIILVIYGHVIEHSMAPFSQDYFQNPVFKIIYTFHMPLFVFISGYLMAYSLNRNSVEDVFKSRCKSLLIPFVTLGILCVAVTYLLGMIFGNMGRIDIAGDLVNQLLLKPSVWFLFTLFALSSLLLYSVKLEKRFGTAIVALIYFFILMIPFNDDCCFFYMKWFYLFYLAGYFFNRCSIEVSNMTYKVVAALVSVILFSWLLSYWTTTDYIYINKMNFVSNHYGEEILRIGYRYIMGFLGIAIAFGLAAYCSTTKLASLLGRVGVYSLDIYIIQMFLLEGIYPRVMQKANINLDFNSPYVLYITAPLLTLFFVGACIMLSKLLIRKNNLLDTLLLGGRK